MTKNKIIIDENKKYSERYALASQRISSIYNELSNGVSILDNEALTNYFRKVSHFMKQIDETYNLVSSGAIDKFTTMQLHHLNYELYEDIANNNYLNSYSNPDYAIQSLGNEFGKYLCVLYTELRSNIAYAFEERLLYLTISSELFIEIYNLFEDKKCTAEQIHSALYYYFFDYSDIMTYDRTRSLLDTHMSFATDIIMNSDLSNPRYLYLFGEYISDNEYATSEYLSSLSNDAIKNMASTYTEGFKKGFEAYRIDLSHKKSVNIRYTLGFERIIKQAILQFKEIGLSPCIYRAGLSLIHRSARGKIGFYGGSASRQYDYDHRMDEALIFDKAYADRKLSQQRAAYENMKQLATEYAGPACLETFGETDFVPIEKSTAVRFNEQQQKQKLEYQASSSLLTNEFIPSDKVSFTIIAYPIPEIGKDYKAIFNETVKVNTLDSALYEKIQTCLIDTLDKGDYVTIKGFNGNMTELKIALTPINNPDKETKFENCLADVNIPLGEVFTSPTLKGTEGLLHSPEIYLNGLKYIDLKLYFKDGIITKYSCGNFENEDENNKYIHENLLYQHDTLPIGEFAIGTNTTAYMMGRKYNISHLLPILIAEKTGPHFAIGDTCFSHEEDMPTYNPDGKEMKAKENDYSKLRDTDIMHAYFNCHTDITIPYNELKSITVHNKDGETTDIILDGRFVLNGTEELNKPLEHV